MAPTPPRPIAAPRRGLNARLRVAVLALCTLGACGDEGTRATVVVRSELPMGALDEVRVQVQRGDEAPIERLLAIGPGASDFPVRVPLVHDSGALGPIEVTVIGRGPAGLEVTGGADPFYFVVGESLTIPVLLSPACVDVACAEGERCVDGVCQGIVVSDAGPGDLGTPDMSEPDLGPMCAAGCDCVLDECVGVNCDCEAGCECALTCPPGQSCDHLHCKDPGTSCTVNAQGADTVDVNCDDAQCTSVDVRGTANAYVRCHKNAACCIVDCTGASNCFVDCEPDAYCRVDCTDASNCGFVETGSCWTDDGPIACGGNVQVCGQPTCPPDDACYPGIDSD